MSEDNANLSEMEILDGPGDESVDEVTDETDDPQDEDTDNDNDGSDDADESENEEEPSDNEDDEQDPDEDEDEDSESKDSDDEGEDPSSLYKKLKKTNPDIFKKYPELKDAIFRDQQFSEVFVTPEQAKATVRDNEIYRKMESDIMAGNPGNMLEALEKTNKDVFLDFAHNFLPSLEKQSKDVYGEVLARPFKIALKNAAISAKKAGNKNLGFAVEHIADFFFGDTDLDNIPEGRSKKESDPREEQIKRRETEFEQRRFNTFQNETNEITIHKLEREVSKSIEKLELNAYTRRKMIGDIIAQIDSLISSDRRHIAGNASLYEQAKSADYSSEWKARISSAYLARARQVINLARKKVLDEAEIKSGKGVSKNKKEAKRIVPGNTSSARPNLKAKDIDFSKTSEDDILNDRITLKGSGKK